MHFERSENYYKTFIVLTCLKCTSHYDTIKIPIMKFCILLGMVSNPTCGSWFYLNRDTSRDSYHAYRGVQHSSLGSNPRLGATAKTISTTKIKGSAHSYNLPFYYAAIFVKKIIILSTPPLTLDEYQDWFPLYSYEYQDWFSFTKEINLDIHRRAVRNGEEKGKSNSAL